jgi:4-amino-4-deoxy-L-arabinose transferase-like glycosyltransferase
MPHSVMNSPARHRTTTVALVVLLLALHVVLAFRGVIGRSATTDEIPHLTAGCAYWQFNDYRLQPENGNLPQRWGALVPYLNGARLDPSARSFDWSTSMVWLIGQHFLFESGQNTDFLLLTGRTAMLFWGVAAGLLVFAWSRALWGRTAGLFSLTLYVVSPTTLAHAPLITSDMCAAVCLLAATGAIAMACRTTNLKWTLLAGLATGLACVAKFSATLLVPIAGLLLIAALVRTWRPGSEVNRTKAALRLAFSTSGAALVSILAIWAFFGWRYESTHPTLPALQSFYLPWDKVLDAGGWSAHVIALLRSAQLLPEAFLYGLTHVLFFANERGAFLAGSYSTTGWWWFFPFAFAVKSTTGEIGIAFALAVRVALKALRLAPCAKWRAVLDSQLLPLLVFGLVYGGAALGSNLNIGHRHLLPLYLVLFIGAGALVAQGQPRALRVTALVLLLASGLESGIRHPHALAFFNAIAGGPSNGWQLLADSSLDWGQDLPALAKWIQTHRHDDEQIYLSQFGAADSRYEGIDGELLSPYFSLGEKRTWIELKPGLYCLSATMLQDVYGPKPGLWDLEAEQDYQNLKLVARAKLAAKEWSAEIPSVGLHLDHPLWLLDRLRFARICQYLRIRPPDAVINHTQFVFRLSAREIEVLVDRPFSELAALMEQVERN